MAGFSFLDELSLLMFFLMIGSGFLRDIISQKAREEVARIVLLIYTDDTLNTPFFSHFAFRWGRPLHQE